MTAYYNEIDPFAAQWLRNLIDAGHIAKGEVDERSIVDIRPSELRGFKQCHFFAGIGVWSLALRRAGWSDDRPVWTGSCPCQPFSAAGKGSGFDDERHLWPHFHWLIHQCQPPVVFGEQVASKDGLAWLDLVQSDLERTGYASGAIDLCAAGLGAPHIRQRLRWIGERVALGDPDHAGLEIGRRGPYEQLGSQRRQIAQRSAGLSGVSGGLADTRSIGRGAGRNGDNGGDDRPQLDTNVEDDRPGPTNGHWRDADWLFCRDGKWRPVEPSTFPLVNGAPSRVGRLRAYGNAIPEQAAQAFIETYMEIAECP